MQLSVTGKQIDVGEALRQHVETTLTGIIDKYFEKAIEAHAVFSREGPLIRSDLTVHVRRDILVQGQAASADAYAAFDSAAEHIAKRIRRYKRRLRGRHGQTHEAVAEALESLSARSYRSARAAESGDERGEDAVSAGDQPVIVAEMTCEIPSLTVGEAGMGVGVGRMSSLIFPEL